MHTLTALIAILAACTDVPSPIEGQVYRCTVTHITTPDVEVYSVCGPWDDWRPAAEALTANCRDCMIDCQGTHHPCKLENGAGAE